jgi:Glycosyltransferase 61
MVYKTAHTTESLKPSWLIVQQKTIIPTLILFLCAIVLFDLTQLVPSNTFKYHFNKAMKGGRNTSGVYNNVNAHLRTASFPLNEPSFSSNILRFSRMATERGAMPSQAVRQGGRDDGMAEYINDTVIRKVLLNVEEERPITEGGVVGYAQPVDMSGDDGMAEDINDTVIRQFFLTVDEERSGGGVVGYAQPVNLVGGVVPSATPTSLNSTHAMCFHLKPDIQHRPHSPACRKDRVLRYTSVRPSQVFSCEYPYDVPGRGGCETGFDGFEPVLRLKGPSFIFTRTPHFPHFLEEVADGANWLKRNNISHFEHALIDSAGGACEIHSDYQTGSWMPNGSPLADTLQIAALKTITRGIVYSWAIRDERTVCLDSPWRGPGVERSTVSPSFFQDDVCYSFRRNMMKIYGMVEPTSRGKKVLILQRARSRVVTNLGDLLNHGGMKALNVTMKMVSLGTGTLSTAEAQVREFLDADILISHHGAGNILATFMRPGSFVLELFNYKCTCHYFDKLASGCALEWKQLFSPQGKTYNNDCNGNNLKDGSDDGVVDIEMVVNILHSYLESRIGFRG